MGNKLCRLSLRNHRNGDLVPGGLSHEPHHCGVVWLEVINHPESALINSSLLLTFFSQKEYFHTCESVCRDPIEEFQYAVIIALRMMLCESCGRNGTDLHHFCESLNYLNFFQIIKSISASTNQMNKKNIN